MQFEDVIAVGSVAAVVVALIALDFVKQRQRKERDAQLSAEELEILKRERRAFAGVFGWPFGRR